MEESTSLLELTSRFRYHFGYVPRLGADQKLTEYMELLRLSLERGTVQEDLLPPERDQP